jgi:hypothetical protein
VGGSFRGLRSSAVCALVCVSVLVTCGMWALVLFPEGALASPPSAIGAQGPVRASPLQTLTALGPAGLNQDGVGIASGRVQDVEQDPFDGRHLIAMSDAALWDSHDAGARWSQLTGLEPTGQTSLGQSSFAFDPAQRDVVLLASPDDLRAPTSSGIYRSSDGGAHWSLAANGQPACPTGGVGDAAVVTFVGHDAYAAAGCVVGTSTDDGMSWTWSAPDPAGEFGGVAVDKDGTLFACGNDGIFEDGSSGWQKVLDFTQPPWALGPPVVFGDSSPASAISTCRMTASPAQAEHLFVTARWSGLHIGTSTDTFTAVFEVFKNQQGTWSFVDLLAPAHNNGRDAYVETRPVYKGFNELGFDLYWNSNDLWYFQQCSLGVDRECAPGRSDVEGPDPDPPWTALSYPALHADAGHILFQTTYPYCIVLVADDGGLQRPGSGNCTGTGSDWSYSDRGIEALEPYDLSLTSNTNTGIRGEPERTDVYVAAQDNGAYALLSHQSGWHQADAGNDGYRIDATTFTSTAHLDSVRVFYGDGVGDQFVFHRGFDSRAFALTDPFSNPPADSGGRTWGYAGLQSPQQIAMLDDGRMVMVATKPSPPNPLVGRIFVSSDDAAHWRLLRASTLNEFASGGTGGGPLSILATQNRAGPVMYVRSGGHLYEVDGDVSSVRELLRGNDVGPYSVADANHLLAYACPIVAHSPSHVGPDCSHSALWWTDGGRLHDLSSLLDQMITTDGFGGHYQLDDGNSDATAGGGEVTAVADSPLNPQLIVVGTRETGLYETGDAGRSWQRLDFSAPNLFNLAFDASGRLYIASFGRGVFQLEPFPERLQLTRSFAKLSRRFRFNVRDLRYGGSPIAHARVDVTLITASGTTIHLGSHRTDSRGDATVQFAQSAATRAATLQARVAGPRNGELMTEARLP